MQPEPFSHLPFHPLLTARLTPTRRRIFGRASARYAALRDTSDDELTQIAVARADLRALRRLAVTAWERFLYFHCDAHLRVADSWIRFDRRQPDERILPRLGELVDELNAARASEAIDLDLPPDHQLRAQQELLFTQAEVLLLIMEASRDARRWHPQATKLSAELRLIMDDFKSSPGTPEEKKLKIVSLSDAAPYRLIKELDLRIARDDELPTKIDQALVGLENIFQWLGGDVSKAQPCRHGRVNLGVADMLLRSGRAKDAASMLRNFIDIKAERLNPQRILATIVEQRLATRFVESFT